MPAGGRAAGRGRDAGGGRARACVVGDGVPAGSTPEARQAKVTESWSEEATAEAQLGDADVGTRAAADANAQAGLTEAAKSAEATTETTAAAGDAQDAGRLAQAEVNARQEEAAALEGLAGDAAGEQAAVEAATEAVQNATQNCQNQLTKFDLNSGGATEWQAGDPVVLQEAAALQTQITQALAGQELVVGQAYQIGQALTEEQLMGLSELNGAEFCPDNFEGRQG